jgi:hypothetical protein
LNINGLGVVNIKRRITSNTRTTVQSEDENFLYKDQPIRLIYNGSAWVADMARANVNDLYGTVPIEKGGTGADNVEEALENLGIISPSVMVYDNNNKAVQGTAGVTQSITVESQKVVVVQIGKFVHVNFNLTVKLSSQTDTINLSSKIALPTSSSTNFRCAVALHASGTENGVLSWGKTQVGATIVVKKTGNFTVNANHTIHGSFGYVAD